GSQSFLVEDLEFGFVSFAQALEFTAEPFDICFVNKVARPYEHAAPVIPPDDDDAIADLGNSIGQQTRWLFLGGIADDVLHLLDENCKNISKGSRSHVVKRKFLLQRLA